MTHYDAWITQPGDYPDLLVLKAGITQSNTVFERTPYFPEGDLAFRALCTGIRSGRFRGTQVDHLVRAALVTKTEINSFLDDVYGPPGEYEQRHGGALQHMAGRMKSLRDFVAELPEDGLFALAADEF